MHPSDLPKQAAITICNEKMNDVFLYMVKPYEEFGLLIKGAHKAIKVEAKEQKGGFLGVFLGTLGASLLRNLLTCKGTIRAGQDI